MAYQIDYRIIDYAGRKTESNDYVIAHESGNPDNVGPNSLENEVKYMQSQAAKGGAFTSHWVGSGGKIVQIAPVGKIQYGAGGVANPKSFAQVELARTNDAATFKKDYAAYVWLLRMLAAECGIPRTLDTTGKGIKTHLWVTRNLGNTTHTDPYGYLNSWGISNAQFAKDIANGLESIAPPTASAPTGGLSVGSKVTVRASATHYQTGQPIASWVKGKTYTIQQVKAVNQSASKRAYLLSDIVSWVLEQDIVDGQTAPTPAQNSFTVKVTTDVLNVRTGPGTGYGIASVIRDKGVYTITSTSGDWGKLKSGAGWISLAYAERV